MYLCHIMFQQYLYCVLFPCKVVNPTRQFTQFMPYNYLKGNKQTILVKLIITLKQCIVSNPDTVREYGEGSSGRHMICCVLRLLCHIISEYVKTVKQIFGIASWICVCVAGRNMTTYICVCF